MPKLWTETIEAHRHQVREAILHATWQLIAEHGLTAVSMSQIAETTGIGRATLYKYFPDVEAILAAWHEERINEHLQQFTELAGKPGGTPAARLESVLHAYAFMSHHREHQGTELAALLHRGEQVARAQQQLTNLLRDLISEAAQAGAVRDDVAPGELASYCLHALTAASTLPSKAAVGRLVAITLAGLRPSA